MLTNTSADAPTAIKHRYCFTTEKKQHEQHRVLLAMPALPTWGLIFKNLTTNLGKTYNKIQLTLQLIDFD